MSHLRNVHNAIFYECRTCNKSLMDAITANKHFETISTCPRSALLANILPIYATSHGLLIDRKLKRVSSLFNDCLSLSNNFLIEIVAISYLILP